MKQQIMRPQDVVVLLKRLVVSADITMTAMAASLCISQSEVSEALERCKVAKLVGSDKRSVNVLALRDFLVSGLQYAFPAVLGPSVRGIPTYISATPIVEQVSADGESYVWPYSKGSARGTSVTPLYATVPEAVLNDKELYKLLVITDALRIGKSRERNIAIHELDTYLDKYVNK